MQSSGTDSEFDLDDIDEDAKVEGVEYKPAEYQIIERKQSDEIQRTLIFNVECQDAAFDQQEDQKPEFKDQTQNELSIFDRSSQRNNQKDKSSLQLQKHKQTKNVKSASKSTKKRNNKGAFLLDGFVKHKEKYDLDFLFQNKIKKKKQNKHLQSNNMNQPKLNQNSNSKIKKPQQVGTSKLNSQIISMNKLMNSIGSPKGKKLEPFFDQQEQIQILEPIDMLMSRKNQKSPQPEIRLMQFQKQIDYKKQQLSQQIEQEKLKECTFTPKLKKSSLKNVQPRSLDVFLDLQKKHLDQFEQKIQSQQEENTKKEKEDYQLSQGRSFLCKGSQKILKDKKRDLTPVHERLFNMHQQNLIEQSNLDYNFRQYCQQKMSFTPQILDKSQEMRKDKSADDILQRYIKKDSYVSPTSEKESFVIGLQKKDKSPQRSFILDKSQASNISYFTNNNYQQSDTSHKLLKNKFEQEVEKLFQKYTANYLNREQKMNYYGLKRILEDLKFLDNSVEGVGTQQAQKQQVLVKKI